MKKGDVVVIKGDRFNTARKITRVLKDGRIQIGKHYWTEDDLREPTIEELKVYDVRNRADRITSDLRGWESLLIEDEVVALEKIYQKLMRRLINEG